MFVSEKFVYLEVHKTGCTHIRKLLTMLCEGRLVGEHNQASQELVNSGRAFIGSVRNPWDWYVSLWAFGCSGQGLLSWSLRSNAIEPKRRQQWSRVYSDVGNPHAFREWLSMIHDSQFNIDLLEGYGDSALRTNVGLLTFRTAKILCTPSEAKRSFEALVSQDDIKRYLNDQCLIDYFVYNENLESDLNHALKTLKVEFKSPFVSVPHLNERSNASARNRDFLSYYDSNSIQLVLQRETAYLEYFGYTAPRGFRP